MAKVLFVVMGDPSSLSESIKAAHAFHYAVELSEKGNEVLVYLDGLGTKIPISDSPYKVLRPAFEEVVRKGLLLGACGYCASPPHLNIRDRLQVKLIGNENNHYAFQDLVEKGYQLVLV